MSAAPFPSAPTPLTAQQAFEEAAQVADDWAAALTARRTPEGNLQAEAARVVARQIRMLAKVVAAGR